MWPLMVKRVGWKLLNGFNSPRNPIIFASELSLLVALYLFISSDKLWRLSLV